MSTIPDSFYQGKADYDELVSSLPSNLDDLNNSEKSKLSLKAWECLEKGIPHSDRSQCLYFFYRLIPLSGEIDKNELKEVISYLPDAIFSSLIDKKTIDYLMLLNSKELFDSCQIRGELHALALRLWELRFDEKLLDDWEVIKKASEEYLNIEPSISIPFIEAYFNAYSYYCYQTKNYDARLYEIARKVFEFSTDLVSINLSRSKLNDDELLRIYKKKTLSPDDVKKIYALEELEKEVMGEFGGDLHIRSTLGKAIGFLSKRGREERAMQKQMQDEWVGHIRSKSRTSNPYIYGYSEYLCSIVYMGTDDIKKSIKSLEKSLSSGFDPGIVLTFLVNIHDNLKNVEEAASYAQKLLDYMNLESLEEAEKNEFDHQLILTIRAANREPKFAPPIWDSIISDNTKKIDKIISDLEPKIDTARKENINVRIDSGIKLLDSLIQVNQIDEYLSSGKNLGDISIDTPLDELVDLSLEEIDFFVNAGIDDLIQFYNTKVPVSHLLNYVEKITKIKYGEVESQIEDFINFSPNLVSSFPIFNKYVASFVKNGNIEIAKKLTNFALEKRPSSTTKNFYSSIKPLQNILHTKERFLEEIELISKSRKVLYDDEFPNATSDLTEAYLSAINNEKSLKKKRKFLEETEQENLSDERLKNIRKEVYFQLNKRKKILTWVGVGLGAIIVIIIVLFILLK